MDNPPLVVLVTGGATGIGQAIAEAFIEESAAVHICDSSAENIAEFLQKNPSASATACDVADAGQVDSVFDDLIARHGPPDVLVNNAGMAGPTAAAENIAVEDWDRCLSVNISGTFYFARGAIPLLKQKGGGVIINISSTAGLMGCPNRSPYVASKWGMIGLTKSWAMEPLAISSPSPSSVKAVLRTIGCSTELPREACTSTTLFSTR